MLLAKGEVQILIEIIDFRLPRKEENPLHLREAIAFP